jgi:hypothetical protein
MNYLKLYSLRMRLKWLGIYRKLRRIITEVWTNTKRSLSRSPRRYSETATFSDGGVRVKIPNYVDAWAFTELRSSYEGRIRDLQSRIDTLETERDEYKTLLHERIGIIKREAEHSAEPVKLNNTRRTPGQLAAQLESDRRRKYWAEKAEEAKANGELSSIGKTEG